MDTKQSNRVEAYKLLADGKGANEVAKKLDLNYRLVCKLKKDLSIYTLDEVLSSIDTEEELVEMLELMKANAPDKLHKKIATLGKGLTGLQAIQTSMQNDLKFAMDKGKKMMEKEDLKASEWVALVNGMTTLYNAIFNKNTGTQVMIDNSNKTVQVAVKDKLDSLLSGIVDPEPIDAEIE